MDAGRGVVGRGADEVGPGGGGIHRLVEPTKGPA